MTQDICLHRETYVSPIQPKIEHVPYVTSNLLRFALISLIRLFYPGYILILFLLITFCGDK